MRESTMNLVAFLGIYEATHDTVEDIGMNEEIGMDIYHS